MRISPRHVAWILLAGSLLASGCGGTRETGTTTRGSRTGIPPNTRLSGERRTVVQESKRWLGTPYCYGGDDGECFDCSGFVSRVFTGIGKKLPRSARDMYAIGEAIARSALRPGDLVFFKNTAGSGITHVGISIGGSQFIHASSSRGVIITSLDDQYYRRHYAGARKLIP